MDEGGASAPKTTRVGGSKLSYYVPVADTPASESGARTELLGGHGQKPAAMPGQRSVAEIEKAYGLKTDPRTLEARAAAEEARKKLAERGEKLSSLEEKTGEMEHESMDFAAKTKKLLEKHKGWFPF